MNIHIEIIKLVIAYSLVGSFLFTLVVTCLSLVNVIKSIDKKLKRKLINVLVVEVAVIAIGSFSNLLKLDAGTVSDNIRSDERDEVTSKILGTLPNLDSLSDSQILESGNLNKIQSAFTAVNAINPGKIDPRLDSLVKSIERRPVLTDTGHINPATAQIIREGYKITEKQVSKAAREKFR